MKILRVLPLFFVLFFCCNILSAQSPQEKIEKLTQSAEDYALEGDSENAIKNRQQILEIYESTNLPKDSIYIELIVLLAHGYSKTQAKSYNEIIEFLLESESAANALPPKHKKAEIEYYDMVSSMYRLAGQFEKGIVYQKKVVALAEQYIGKEEGLTAECYRSLASLYMRVRRYEDAKLLLLHSLGIQEKKGEKYTPRMSSVLNSLGGVYGRMGDKKKAGEYYLKSLEVTGKAYGLTHEKYGRALSNLAANYSNTGRYDEAKKLLLQALEIRKKKLPFNHYKIVTTLDKLGILYGKQGDKKKAQEIFRECIRLTHSFYGEKHPRITSSYLPLINSLLRDTSTEPTLDLFQKAINANSIEEIDTSLSLQEIVKKHTFTKHGTLMALLSSWAGYYQNRYQRYQKIEDLEGALDVLLAACYYVHKTLPSIPSQKDKLELFQRVSFFLERAVITSFDLYQLRKDEQYLAQILQLAEANKSVILSATLTQTAALNLDNIPKAIQAKHDSLTSQLDKLQSAMIKAHERKDTIKINKKRAAFLATQLKLDELEKELDEKYANYKALKYQVNPLDINELKASLAKTNTQLIEYFQADENLFIILVNASEIKIYKQELKESFQKDLEQFRKSLSNYQFIVNEEPKAYKLYTEQASAFYQLLIKPIQDELSDDKILIVSDGLLGHIPFEALLTKPILDKIPYADLPYLISKYPVSYSYASKLWLENQNRQVVQNKGVFGCAASYAKNDLAKQRDQTQQEWRQLLGELPAAEEEIMQLATKYSGQFFKKAQANEKQFKTKALDAKVIHLAMHGLLNEKYPMFSSLAFTEDGDSTEDNFLHAYEISNLKLNADLVVLSACETGYGKFEQGEGVMSLARSFMQAGVPSLVVSLWQVNDGSTSMIMQELYTELAKGSDKSNALRQAKLNYIQRIAQNNQVAAHPAFWAPFIQLGNSESIDIDRKSNALWWYLGIGGLFLLSIIGFYAYHNRNKE